MKHTIEFHYDGEGEWSYNGGYIMPKSEVMLYVGREAFYEAMKHGVSFRATFEVTVENIETGGI